MAKDTGNVIVGQPLGLPVPARAGEAPALQYVDTGNETSGSPEKGEFMAITKGPDKRRNELDRLRNSIYISLGI
jgi:hypothetical protein